MENNWGESEYLQACLLAEKNEPENALIALQNAINEGLIFYEDLGEFDIRLMPLVDDPKFKEIWHPLSH